jgi:hypothetical protein
MRKTVDSDRRGYYVGRKAKEAGKGEPSHKDKAGNPRSSKWIEWMQKGYYGSKAGAPSHGENRKEVVSCRIDQELKDKAIALSINRSASLEMALRILTTGQVEKLTQAMCSKIKSITVNNKKTTIVDCFGVVYTAKTPLEALILLLIA